jgi:DnaJ domain
VGFTAKVAKFVRFETNFLLATMMKQHPLFTSMKASRNSLLSGTTRISTFRPPHHRQSFVWWSLLGKKHSYYTNADRVKKEDPYAILGLQWGDGATLTQIKAAYLARAAILHPDVNPNASGNVAKQQFQKLRLAYEQLTKAHSHTNGGTADAGAEEWRVSLWRNGDRIALNRTDVAGTRRLRPIPPVSVDNVNAYTLGSNSGAGAGRSSSDYIGTSSSSSSSGSATTKQPSSVGTGRSKWVTPVAYKPWKKDG